MSRSQSLLIISGALLGACGGDDSCGTMGAPAVGLVASSSMVTLTYGNLTASANNDCPAAGAPAGVVSLTLMGAQTDGTGLITLCIGRPDQLDTTPLALGTAVKLVDLAGTETNGTGVACSYAIDNTQAPTGTATGKGVCDNGSDATGFELIVNGTLSLGRTCGTTVDTTPVTLAGMVAVTVPPS